jgi:hypothetical protein
MSSGLHHWEQYRTTQTVPRAGCLIKLSNQAIRTKNPMTCQKREVSTALHQSELHGRVAMQKIRHPPNVCYLLPEFDQVVAASWDKPLDEVGFLTRGLVYQTTWHHRWSPAHCVTANLTGQRGRLQNTVTCTDQGHEFIWTQLGLWQLTTEGLSQQTVTI